MKRASSLSLTTYLFVTYIEIKRDAQNKEDVTMVAVGLNEHFGSHSSVGQTAMSELSSRSQYVFALHLKAVHSGQGIDLKTR